MFFFRGFDDMEGEKLRRSGIVPDGAEYKDAVLRRVAQHEKPRIEKLGLLVN